MENQKPCVIFKRKDAITVGKRLVYGLVRMFLFLLPPLYRSCCHSYSVPPHPECNGRVNVIVFVFPGELMPLKNSLPSSSIRFFTRHIQ